LGEIDEAKPGRNRVTWDPAASPFAGKTLTGFTVSVTMNAGASNRYLIIDLENGGVSYAAQPNGTDGKWSDEYKSKKMVFRRIPAGVYQLGMESNLIAKVNGGPVSSTYATAWRRHDITFTSDFYVGVYKMTVAQYNQLNGPNPAQYPLRPKMLSYHAIRGASNIVEGVVTSINWPKTGYEVSSDSLLAKLRSKAGAVDFQIDLCHECQWEAAMRSGTTAFWPNGGMVDDSLAMLTNLVDAIAWRGDTKHNVGEKLDNGWGIYDPVGLQPEWTLSASARTGNFPKTGLSDATDPVGSSLASPDRRVVRASGDSSLLLQLPCCRQLMKPEEATASARFCIHLQPLNLPTPAGSK